MKGKGTAAIFIETRKKLKRLANKSYRLKLRKQLGPRVKIYGVRSSQRAGIVSALSAYFRRSRDVDGAIDLAVRLIKTRTFEETNIGLEMLVRFAPKFGMHAFWQIERLLDNMNTSVNADLLCDKLLGPILVKYSHDTRYIYYWAESTNKWRRRASATVLLKPLARKKDIGAAFVIAKKLSGEKNETVLEGLEKLMLVLVKWSS
jgi:3-methyladenine DNA glycosylase AlkD